MIRTNENASQFEHTLNHCVEFFFKAGSLFSKRGHYYGNSEPILSLFQKAWIVDPVTSLKLLFWVRDRNGGAGNRSGFRECLVWLANHAPQWVESNMHLIPHYGRWDDLRCLFDTRLKWSAAKLWGEAIRENNLLAAKWADRSDKPLRYHLKLKTEAEFRKLLASIRKSEIIEHSMTTREYESIEYAHVPSVAMARYTNAFSKNDKERFESYKESLKTGESKINASVLFPHDCVRTALTGDSEIANAQFEALPNYLEGVDRRIIVLSDTSGSMNITVGGTVTAYMVSVALALYCSAKISETNPFHKKFIGFESESTLKNWNGKSFSEAVGDRKLFDRAVGSTEIHKALDLILTTAQYFNLTNDQIPNVLLIVSDMQFTDGNLSDERTIETSLKQWDAAGYSRPSIVYWNLDSYSGSPELAMTPNTALISGFSPSILKSVFSGESFTPIDVMNEALEKYQIVTPN